MGRMPFKFDAYEYVIIICICVLILVLYIFYLCAEESHDEGVIGRWNWLSKH